MGEFYIRQPDELYHYGVKGMRWGVRHDPERTGRRTGGSSGSRSSSKKKMSTAKKVAIGVGVAAAVAGVSYAAVKTHKTSVYNKAARLAVQKAMISANKAGGAYKPGMNVYKEVHGSYKIKAGRGVQGFNIGAMPSKNKSFKGQIKRNVHLTGHSGRVTKFGAARHRSEYYSKKALSQPVTSDYMTNASNPRRKLEAKANSAQNELNRLYRKSYDNMTDTGKIPAYNRYDSVNKLKRKKKR